jgi:hypothetical protein
MINIAVVDAQGGGLGAAIIKSLIEKYGERINVLALGTNGIATTAMKKSGAAACATGENAICFNVRKADIIMGGVGIIAANAMMGEITPEIAKAVSESDAQKILIPVSKCNIIIPGASGYSVKELIEKAADAVAPSL